MKSKRMVVEDSHKRSENYGVEKNQVIQKRFFQE